MKEIQHPLGQDNKGKPIEMVQCVNAKGETEDFEFDEVFPENLKGNGV